MKKLLFISLGLLLPYYLLSQATKTDGPIEKGASAPDIVAMIGSTNNSFFILRKDNNTLIAEGYNKTSMVKEWSTEIPTEAKQVFTYRKGYFCGIQGKQLFVLIPGLKNKKVTLILRTMDLSGKLNSEERDLATFELFEKLDIENWDYAYKYSSPFEYFFSPDSSKALLWSHHRKGEGLVIDIKTMSITANAFPRQFEGKDITPWNPTISNEGKIAYGFLLSAGSNDYIFKVALVENNAIIKTISPNFQVADKFILEDFLMVFGKNKILQFAGVATDAKKEEGKKKNSAVYAFTYDLISSKLNYEATQYLSAAWGEKYDPAKTSINGTRFSGHSDYEFSFYFPDDGSWIISALKKNGWNRNSKFHGTDDALLWKVDKSKIEWVKVLPISVARRGGFNKDGLLSYWNCTGFKNKVYYFFDSDIQDETKVDLNNVEGSSQSETVVSFADKNINTSCVVLDLNGKLQRFTVCNNKERGFEPVTGPIVLEKNKVLLHFMGNGKQNFSWISLP